MVCWDSNQHGKASPPPGDFVYVGTGWDHACGLRSDGTVVCWGNNESGEATPPQGVFSEISVGDALTCGVRVDGGIDCWGGDSTVPDGTDLTSEESGGRLVVWEGVRSESSCLVAGGTWADEQCSYILYDDPANAAMVVYWRPGLDKEALQSVDPDSEGADHWELKERTILPIPQAYQHLVIYRHYSTRFRKGGAWPPTGL